MKLKRILVKAFSWFIIQLFSFIQCFFISLMFTSPFVCVALAVISIVLHRLPVVVNKYFCLILIVCCIPAAIVFFIKVSKDMKKNNSLKQRFEKEIKERLKEQK